MKITSYNQHCSAPFPEPWSSNSCQVYSVEGADAVIQSAGYLLAMRTCEDNTDRVIHMWAN
jgi:hypothetical protein